MQGYDGERQIVTRTVPTGGVVADGGYVIGDEFLVAMSTATEATTAEFVRVGVCKFIPKTTGQTNTRGAKAFFNPTTGKTENASSATNYLIGTFDAAAESADIYSSVLLVGAPVAVGGVPGDIQSVVAGSGLTGGGSSGAVTLACDFGTGSGEVAEGDHTHDATDITHSNAALPAETEVGGFIDALIDVARVEPKVKQITVALGATSGTSAGDVTMIGGRVVGIVPVSGADQPPAGYSIHGTTGVITLTLAGASTAEAVYDVWVKPVIPA